MFRYYLLATALVVLVGSILVARRLPAPDLRIVAEPSGTPTVEVPAPRESVSPPAFAAEGSWVLSALPACFEERSRVRGTLPSLRAKLPDERTRVQPPATVRAGNCTLLVRTHDIWVYRGPDRMRVPPEAKLYRDGQRLTLVVRTGRNVEIRQY